MPTLTKLSAANTDRHRVHHAGNFGAELFGNVLQHYLEATQAVYVLGRLDDCGRFFFGTALLLEVFGRLRQKSEVSANRNVVAQQVFDHFVGGLFGW